MVKISTHLTCKYEVIESIINSETWYLTQSTSYNILK